MKKISIVLTICLVALFSTEQVHAQLSKKEKKEWKTKAKQYKKNPQALKQLDDDRSNLDTEVTGLKSQIQSLQSKLSDKDATIASLQSDIQKSRADLMAARKQVSDLQAAKTPAVSSGGKMVDGVVFKVQIGAFRNKDLSKYFENHENFSGEVDEDGTQKITLGQYRDYWEADTFKKYLREMGVKDAWIVPYKDGVRVDIKDVLEGVTGDGTSGSGE